MIDDNLVVYSREYLKHEKREIAMLKACKKAGVDHIALEGVI